MQLAIYEIVSAVLLNCEWNHLPFFGFFRIVSRSKIVEKKSFILENIIKCFIRVRVVVDIAITVFEGVDDGHES